MERFRTIWPAPHFAVVHNTRLQGKKSGARRQIDIRVSEAGKPRPFLVAEVKMHRRAVALPTAGAAIALIRDVGVTQAVVVSASGFSASASRYLTSEGIDSMVVTLDEATYLRWLPDLERHFQLDREFREVSGILLEALRNSDAVPFLDADLPYEEWLAVVICGWGMFPEATRSLLATLAREHYDDGVGFNTVGLLDEAGCMSAGETEELLRNERDPEVRMLLEEVLERWKAVGNGTHGL